MRIIYNNFRKIIFINIIIFAASWNLVKESLSPQSMVELCVVYQMQIWLLQIKSAPN